MQQYGGIGPWIFLFFTKPLGEFIDLFYKGNYCYNFRINFFLRA